MKCIHFPLPSGAGGMAAAHQLGQYRSKLTQFCKQHGITSYFSATEGYNYYVWFDDEKFYTLFFLVWDSSPYWRKPQLVEKDKDSAPYNRQVTIAKE